jgi:hypothetical protein
VHSTSLVAAATREVHAAMLALVGAPSVHDSEPIAGS